MAVPWLNSPAQNGTDQTNPLQGLRLDDLVTKFGDTNRILGQLLTILTNLSPLLTGQVTLAASASTTVTNAAIAASSAVIPVPINAAAGTLIKNEGYYVTAASGSFTFHTASGASATGNESLIYLVFTTL